MKSFSKNHKIAMCGLSHCGPGNNIRMFGFSKMWEVQFQNVTIRAWWFIQWSAGMTIQMESPKTTTLALYILTTGFANFFMESEWLSETVTCLHSTSSVLTALFNALQLSLLESLFFLVFLYLYLYFGAWNMIAAGAEHSLWAFKDDLDFRYMLHDCNVVEIIFEGLQKTLTATIMHI